MLSGYQKWHKGFAGYHHQGRVLFYVLGRHVVSLGKMLNCVKFRVSLQVFNCEELSLELDPRFYQIF